MAQQNTLRQKTKSVTQENFPGCLIEPQWSKFDAIEKAPFYALRLAMNSDVILNPQGNKDYIGLEFEGKEFIIYGENFEYIYQLFDDYVICFLERKGYKIDIGFRNTLRYNPNLILDSINFLQIRAKKLFDVPAKLTRIFMPILDISAPTYYRTVMPSDYLKTKDDFYTEASMHFSHTMLSHFDVVFINRSPQGKLIPIFESIKRENKIIVYETDDDLFNIPEWNPAYEAYTDKRKEEIRGLMNMADLMICTNDHLASLLRKESKLGDKCQPIFVGPNLLKVNSYTKRDPNKSRSIDDRWMYYKPYRIENEIIFKAENRPDMPASQFNGKVTQETYDPVTILWTGSPTHEKDIEQLATAVINLGEKYGMGIRFVFQGYLPICFADGRIEAGQNIAETIVKEEYGHFIFHVPRVDIDKYQQILIDIDADFALCPLCNEHFNLSKSNIKPLEMAACGIPSIVSDFGPYKFIEHGFNGLKVAINNTNDWYKSIEELFLEVEYRKMLGENAYQTVVNEWSWEHESINRSKWDTIFLYIQDLANKRKAENRQYTSRAYQIINQTADKFKKKYLESLTKKS